MCPCCTRRRSLNSRLIKEKVDHCRKGLRQVQGARLPGKGEDWFCLSVYLTIDNDLLMGRSPPSTVRCQLSLHRCNSSYCCCCCWNCLHDLARIAAMTSTICTAILCHNNSRPAAFGAFSLPSSKIPYYLSDWLADDTSTKLRRDPCLYM